MLKYFPRKLAILLMAVLVGAVALIPLMPAAAQDDEECVLTLLQGATIRAEASTDAAEQGALGAGEERIAIGYEIDAANQGWWRLRAGGWVREDLVFESPGCEAIGGDVEAGAAADEDVCTLTVLDGGAILRAEATTASDEAGAVGEGEELVAIDVATDAAGQDWWRLRAGGWVREDLVAESAECDTLGDEMNMLEITEEDVCIVTALDTGAIVRAEATTESAESGALGADEQRVAIGYDVDDSTVGWWRLRAGGWVREDLVSESEECDEIGGDAEAVLAENEEICMITILDGGAIVRAEASVDSEEFGALGGDETRPVINFEVDEGGQTWWRLRAGGWVREDLATESEECDLLVSGELDDEEVVDIESLDVCTIAATTETVLRADASADAAELLPLAEGEAREVRAYEDGWWQLRNGMWASEADVIANSACADVQG